MIYILVVLVRVWKVVISPNGDFLFDEIFFSSYSQKPGAY